MKNIIRFEYGAPVELPLQAAELDELKEYLQSMWRNRRFLQDFEVPDAENPPFFHWEGAAFFPRNYVGFIKFKDWIIEIYPKIFSAQPLAPTKMLHHLLYYLSYAAPQHYAWQSQEGTQDKTPCAWGFYQKMILAQIKTYLTRHLYQSYEKQTDLLPYLRGKIAFESYFKDVLSSAKWHQTPSTFEKIQINNPLNQLLKYVLRQWQSEDTSFQGIILDLLSFLSEVEEVYFTFREAQGISLPAAAREAHQILDFCLYFLENQAASLGKQSFQNFVWLLPMERIYEQFVVGFIKEHFPEALLVLQKSTYLATTKKDEKPVFRIQPDIYLPQQHKIIDTKYKLRNGTQHQANGGISSGDMYQILSYALGRQCQDMLLLYPARHGAEATEVQDFEVKEGVLAHKPISVRALDMRISTEAVQDWRSELDKLLISQFREFVF